MKRREADYGPDMDEELQEERQEEPAQEKRGLSGRMEILAGVGVLAAALLIAGCVKGCGSSHKVSGVSMQSVIEQYMEDEGDGLAVLDSLNDADRERVLSTAVSVLEKLIGDGSAGYDREYVLSGLEKALADLNLGLSESALHTVAEKLLELYANNYDSVYTEVEKTNNSVKYLENSMTSQMEENLYTITDYLTQLDSEIVVNQSTLEKVLNTSQEINASMTELHEKTDEIKNQVSASLSEIRNEFGAVNTQLVQSQEKLDAFYAKYDQNSETLYAGITSVQSEIKAAQNQITASQQVITDALTQMENKNVARQNEINQKFSEVASSIKATQDQLKKTEESIQDALGELEDSMEENQKELVKLLSGMEDSIRKALDDNMAAVDARFSALQKSVDASFAKLQENLDLSVLMLKEQMDGLHAQILATQTEITGVLQAMDEKRDLQYGEIMNAIQGAVDSINAEMAGAHSRLEELILQLKEDGEADHAETLAALQGMEGSLAESMADSLNQVNVSFSELNASLAQYFEQLEQSQGAGQNEINNALGELGNDLQENQQVLLDGLSAHDSANRQGQEEIKDAILKHDADMRSYIDSLKDFLKEKLDSVFTYVSNGKKLLASALLTKGVTVREDATFREFSDAILSVPQTIMVGEMAGTIAYDYHYHTDASGNRVGEVKTSETQGGCYTVPVFHTHGDTCYNWSHEHTSSCKTKPLWVDWVPGKEPYWGATYACENQPANVRGSLKCGLPSSSDGKPVYYELGCGLVDGQIVAAHIVYSEQAGSSENKVIPPEEGDIKADGAVNEPEYPDPIETEQGQEESTDVEETESRESETETGVEETEGTRESDGIESGLEESEESPEKESGEAGVETPETEMESGEPAEKAAVETGAENSMEEG